MTKLWVDLVTDVTEGAKDTEEIRGAPAHVLTTDGADVER